MRSTSLVLLLVILFALSVLGCQNTSQSKSAENNSVKICYSSEAGFQEQLAAKEIRRYLYLRTDRLFELDAVESVPSKGDLILIATKDSDLIKEVSYDGAGELKSQEYTIKTIDHNGRKIVVICGGDSIGALYGAYCMCSIQC